MNTHSQTLKLVVGLLGNVIGVCVNLAPIGTFWNIYKKRDCQGFSGLPYVFSLVAALIWVLYGLPSVTEHALLIITINVASSAIQIFYLTIFVSFAARKPKRQLIKVMSACLVWVASLALLTLKVVPQPHRSLTVGSICVVIGVITYASPLSVAGTVIRTRSARFLPIVLCTCLLFNSTIWTCYGIITRDIFVLIPNVVGVVFGVAQISLYLWYRNAKPLDGFPEKCKSGDDYVVAVDDKSFDKSNGKSLDGFPEKGKSGDAYEVAVDDSSFDKPNRKSLDRFPEKGKSGDAYEVTVDDKSFDKSFDKPNGKSLNGFPEKGKSGDAYEVTFDDKSFDKPDGKIPPTTSYENLLPHSVPSDDFGCCLEV